jgi:hypothetical protein
MVTEWTASARRYFGATGINESFNPFHLVSCRRPPPQQTAQDLRICIWPILLLGPVFYGAGTGQCHTTARWVQDSSKPTHKNRLLDVNRILIYQIFWKHVRSSTKDRQTIGYKIDSRRYADPSFRKFQADRDNHANCFDCPYRADFRRFDGMKSNALYRY